MIVELALALCAFAAVASVCTNFTSAASLSSWLPSYFQLGEFNIFPLMCYIVADVFGITDCWGERLERRVLHHIHGSEWNKYKFPRIYAFKKLDVDRTRDSSETQGRETSDGSSTCDSPNVAAPNLSSKCSSSSSSSLKSNVLIHDGASMLSHEQIKTILALPCCSDHKEVSRQNLNQLKICARLINGQYSKRSTLYLNDFDHQSKTALEKIANDIKPRFEAVCGEKLQLGESDFRLALLRYEGHDAAFGFHYDMEPATMYRSLVLIKSQGRIPPFSYQDYAQNYHDVHLDLGEGIFFKGTQTRHGVRACGDPDAVRWMLGFQFTSAENAMHRRSFCSEFRGGSIQRLVAFLLPIVFKRWILLYIAGRIYHISMDCSLFILMCAAMLLLFYFLLPRVSMSSWNLGTGYAPSVVMPFQCFGMACVATLQPTLSLGLTTWILVTESCLPTELVARHVFDGGT
jgi:hypothetical protein